MNTSTIIAPPPRITVIIAAYNAKITLGRAIESVLSQQFKDFKMIVVYDG